MGSCLKSQPNPRRPLSQALGIPQYQCSKQRMKMESIQLSFEMLLGIEGAS